MATIGCYFRSQTVYDNFKRMLEQAGLECERFGSETALLRNVARRNFDLLLLDIGTSLADAECFVSWIACRSGDQTPVVVLSAANSPEFAAMALDAGASDFLPAHFEPIEATARIRAAIKRGKPAVAGRMISLAGFTLDREASRIAYDGVPVELTPREFVMAWLFFSSPGIYISRNTLGSTIWSADSEVAGRTIEQHVYKLRKKLQLGPARRLMIRTAYSQGYRLELMGTAD